MSDNPDEDVSPEAEEPPRPEAEVWNHLWSGYDLAYHDLQETVGGEAASIALARSAFEQMAREVLIHRGLYTRVRLDRERPTAFKLLHELKRNALIDSIALKAEALVVRGNTIAHKHMYEERIMQQQALTSIAQLVEVLSALAAHLPQSPEATA